MVVADIRVTLFLISAFALLTLGACGDGNDTGPAKTAVDSRAKLTAVLASSDLAVGKQRVSFVVLDGDVPVTANPAYVRFFKDAARQPRVVGSGAIPWSALGTKEEPHGGAGHTETELSGIYFANVEFDEAGEWGIGITPGAALDESKEIRLRFTVNARSQAIGTGEKAVPVRNPTAKDLPLKQIHTGADADPAFHTMTVAEATSSGKPAVIVFATPSFCRTRTCGPALQVATKAAAEFAGKINFVHIEPYELKPSGELAEDAQGNPFKLVDTAVAWRLPSEPWVFVVDRSGVVVARFEGPYALEELQAVLTALTA